MMATAARTERLTIAVIAAVGFLIFLVMAGVSGGMAYSKYGRSQSWTGITATVEQIEPMCEVEHKSGKSWELAGVLTCKEAATVVAERNGVLTPWRSTQVDYAAISYEAGGAIHRQTLRASAISDAVLAVGDRIPMMMNPDDPDEVEKPFSSSDMEAFWIATAVGALIWLVTSLVGFVVAKLNRRIHEKAAAKAAATL